MNSRFIRKINLEHINILKKNLMEIGKKENKISEVIKVEININKYKKNI